jgi:hypothetical protein
MLKVTLTLLLSFSIGCLFAQHDTVYMHLAKKRIRPIAIKRPPEALSLQFFGSSPFLSVNYDRRLKRRVDGLGFSVGIGGSSVKDSTKNKPVVTLPLALNYLFGKHTDFIEVCGGVTLVSNYLDIFNSVTADKVGFYAHVGLGYRHQPVLGGLFYRLGVSPLYSPEESGMSYYFGIGYNLKRATK